MNRKYRVVDGCALILDDENKFSCSYQYTDNLEEELIMENQIEYLEKEIEEYNGFLNYKDKSRTKNRQLLKTVFGFSIPLIILLNMFLSIKFGSPIESISTISNIVNNFVIIATPATLVTFSFIEKIVLGSSKVEKDINARKKIAENEIKILKDKLYEISKKANSSCEVDKFDDNFSLIDDREAIKRIEQICSLKLQYLKNKRKMLRLAKEGKLNAYLYELGYNDSEVLASVEDSVYSDVNKLKLSRKNNK